MTTNVRRIGDTNPEQTHAAPHRARFRGASLGFALFGAPLAWLLQLLAGAGLAHRACPARGPLAPPMLPWASTAIVAVTLLAIAVGCAAGVVAWRGWRRTRTEHEGGHHSLLDVGEGRSRFLAVWGMCTSAGFLIALLTIATALLVVPLCSP